MSNDNNINADGDSNFLQKHRMVILPLGLLVISLMNFFSSGKTFDEYIAGFTFNVVATILLYILGIGFGVAGLFNLVDFLKNNTQKKMNKASLFMFLGIICFISMDFFK